MEAATPPPFLTQEKKMQNEEIWKDIPGLEGEYQASSLGNLKSLDRTIEYINLAGKICNRAVKGKIIKPTTFRDGYKYVRLARKYDRAIPVHELIARAFIGPKPEGLYVKHLNGIKDDNSIQNLSYSSKSDCVINGYVKKGHSLKLSIEEIKLINSRLRAGDTQAQIARDFGVSDVTISGIKSKRINGWVE